MSPKLKIRAIEMVNDIRSGMTDPELMKKFNLSPGSLQRVFRKLLEAEAISPDEIFWRPPATDEIVDFGAAYRILDRYELDITLPVYELNNPDNKGMVKDICVNGVGIRGVEAVVNEIKIFVIPAEKLFGNERVEFDAICRWAKRDKIDGECSSGFEVLTVTRGNLKDLEMAIRRIPLDDRVALQKRS
jgi:hypothetical protein